MKKYYYILLIISLIISSNAQAEDKSNAKNNTTLLTISSTAKYKATPDIALISAGITTENFSANDALRENSVKMNNVFQALKNAHIDKKDIQTSGINIMPQYNYIPNLPPKIKTYRVNNTVIITIRNIKNIGTTLDALVNQGVNTINGPSFSVENPDSGLDIARKNAIKKAQHKAKLYADAMGLKISRVISISEGYSQSQPVLYSRGISMMKASSMMELPTPISSGQINLNSSVNIQYELAHK